MPLTPPHTQLPSAVAKVLSLLSVEVPAFTAGSRLNVATQGPGHEPW